MQDRWLRKVPCYQPVHSFPRPCCLTLLTATSQLMEPELRDFGDELVESTKVIRYWKTVDPSRPRYVRPGAFPKSAANSNDHCSADPATAPTKGLE